MEPREVLGRIVTGLFEAARIEKNQQRRFRGGKAILPREARAGSEALANLRVLRAGQELDDARLARLRLAEQPEHRDGRLLDEIVEPPVKLAGAGNRKEALDRGEHL